jgi:predicted nucleic acid-binding protein
MKLIVDSGVAVKWFIPEVLSTEAKAWRDATTDLHTLAFFFDLEIASVLWKKIGRSEISEADADAILAQLPVLPLARHDDASVLTSSFTIANQTRRSVYDCMYLALAVALRGRMLTADEKFVNALKGTPWEPYVVWVGEAPH